MQNNQINYGSFIGFDVSKDSITVYDSQSEQICEIQNTASALRKYIKNIDNNALTICEPTGGYEAILLDVLLQYKIPVHRCDARRVKAYIRSLGIYAKTDAIDAKALAAYASERHEDLCLWSMPPQSIQELQILMSRRQELLVMRIAEKNRSQAPLMTQRVAKRVHKSCCRLIRLINQELMEIEELIESIIDQDQTLTDVNDILTSFKGIGKVSAFGLLCVLPELGKISRRQIASLAGLAPHPKQSGKVNAYRKVSGGRQQAKQILFMVAIVAARRNEDMKIFYDRLLKNGKKKMVALTAVMRKIITILNAQVRDYYKNKQMS